MRTRGEVFLSFFFLFFLLNFCLLLCLVFLLDFSTVKRALPAYAGFCCQCGPLSCWTCRHTFGCFSCAPYESEGGVLFLLFYVLHFLYNILALAFYRASVGVCVLLRSRSFWSFWSFWSLSSLWSLPWKDVDYECASHPVCIPQLLHTSHFMTSVLFFSFFLAFWRFSQLGAELAPTVDEPDRRVALGWDDWTVRQTCGQGRRSGRGEKNGKIRKWGNKKMGEPESQILVSAYLTRHPPRPR